MSIQAIEVSSWEEGGAGTVIFGDNNWIKLHISCHKFTQEIDFDIKKIKEFIEKWEKKVDKGLITKGKERKTMRDKKSHFQFSVLIERSLDDDEYRKFRIGVPFLSHLVPKLDGLTFFLEDIKKALTTLLSD